MHTIPHTVLPPITLEGGYNKVRTPRSQGFVLIRPASTQPRPSVGQQGGKADVAQDSGSFHRLVPDVTMVSSDGRPFLGHVATAASIGIDKLHLKAPRRPGLLLPYKRAGPGSTREKEKRSKHHQTNKRRGKPVSSSQINISNNHPCTLSFPLRPGLSSLSHNL
jgi:hypothetical protein